MFEECGFLRSIPGSLPYGFFYMDNNLPVA